MARTMKVLLRESVKNVGRVGDIVEVTTGFARNYLLPRRLAVQPTPANIKLVEARRQEIERIERERRDQQQALLKQLEGVTVTLERKANEQGHLFGSVTATDIARWLQDHGFNINADDINLPGRMDRIETYTVQVRFAEDLAGDLRVSVDPDPESRALIEEARKAAEAEARARAEQEQKAQEEAAQKAARKGEKTEKGEKGGKGRGETKSAAGKSAAEAKTSRPRAEGQPAAAGETAPPGKAQGGKPRKSADDKGKPAAKGQ